MSKDLKILKNGGFFLFIALLLYLLVSPELINAIPALKLNVSRQIVLVICLLVLMIPMIFGHKIRIFGKGIIIAFLFRIAFFGVYSLFFIEDYFHYISYCIIAVIFPIVFIATQSINIDAKKALVILAKLSVILVGMQTASAFFTLVIQGHGLYQIKSLIAIPFGSSNTIATIAIFQMVICYYFISNKIYFVISTVSLLLTISKWGFLSYFVVLIVALVLNSNIKHKFRNICLYFMIIIFVYQILLKFLPTYLSVYGNAINRIFDNDFSTLYNGRDFLYREYIHLISQKIFLGYGFGIRTPSYGMAHNFLLQSLYFGGILGTFIYYIPYLIILRNGIKKSSKPEKNALIILVLALFVNGYAENVFFTDPSEFISGIYISLIYRYLLSRGEENTCE